MDKKKMIVLAGFIIVIMLSIILFVILDIVEDNKKNAENEDKSNNVVETNHSDEYKITGDDGPQYDEELAKLIMLPSARCNKLQSRNAFFMVESLGKKYYSYVAEGGRDVVLGMLDEKYKNSLNITTENVFSIVTKYSDGKYYKATEIYSNSDNEYDEYYIRGEIRGSAVYNVISLDKTQNAFSIYPINQSTYDAVAKSKEIPGYERKKIEKNKYNSVKYENVDEDKMSSKYFEDYIDILNINPEQAYSMLDEEYRKAKFPSYENFRTYLKYKNQLFTFLNKRNIRKESEFSNKDEYTNYLKLFNRYALSHYNAKANQLVKEYTCEDNIGNIYIFTEQEPNKYTVKLYDTIVETDEEIEKFAKAENDEKIFYIGEKIGKMFNEGSYGYLYSKINAEFRVKNFPNETSFENYIKERIYARNKVDVEDMENYGDILVKLNIVNAENEKDKRQMNLVIRIKENGDYEFSLK